jgi:large subunit ribosomal protein L30
VTAARTIRVTLRRSPIGTTPSQRRTLETLRLRSIGRTVEVVDSPAMQGKLRAVAHLVETEG